MYSVSLSSMALSGAAWLLSALCRSLMWNEIMAEVEVEVLLC